MASPESINLPQPRPTPNSYPKFKDKDGNKLGSILFDVGNIFKDAKILTR